MTDFPTKTQNIDSRFVELSTEHREVLFSCVAEMVDLDSHIEAALDRQLAMTKGDSLVGPLVRGFHDSVRDQRNMMIELRDAMGDSATNSLKEAGASVLGTLAGFFDKLRSEGISKAMRDDYTAFNLAAVSYTMLLTTAKSVGSNDVAAAAERGLKVYATAVQKINQALPSVVLADLAQKHKISASSDIADDVRRQIDRIWKATDQSNVATPPR